MADHCGLSTGGCLDQWSEIRAWQSAGIGFAGSWEQSEIAVVLEVLDHFAATFSEARFLELVRQARPVVPLAEAGFITIARTSDPDLPPAAWARNSGRVLINDSLFDAAYLHKHYAWTTRWHTDGAEPRRLSAQVISVAHEIGHVVADAILNAQAASPSAPTITASTIIQDLDRSLWLHPDEDAEETIATELGLWALGAPRPSQILHFRHAQLAPMVFATTEPLPH
ncbi:MAG: hypothetical protein JXC32_08730 [Anaerolineae bacterium]|nr:hypothetical protein [Anaerolineae bacterium]